MSASRAQNFTLNCPLYPEARFDLLPGDAAMLGDLSTAGVGGLVTKKRLGPPPLPSPRYGSL